MRHLIVIVICLAIAPLHGCSRVDLIPEDLLSTAETIALTNANVIDGIGLAARPSQTILIRRGLLVALGEDLEIPPDAVVLDLKGKSILPGLIDMHGHLYANVGMAMQTQFEAYPKLYLAGGVTTIFSPGEFEPQKVFDLKVMIQNEELVGPNILFAGPYFDGNPSDVGWINGSKSAEAIEQQFDTWKTRMDAAKVYTSISEEQLERVVDLANQAGMFVTGHLESVSAERAIDIGINGLEHGLLSFSEFSSGTSNVWDYICELSDFDIQQESVSIIFQKMILHEVYLDPTIVTLQSMVANSEPVDASWRDFTIATAEEFIDRFFESGIPSDREELCIETLVEKQLEFVSAFHDLGGIIVAGTDPVLPSLTPGSALHREIQNLVGAGLTPMEAIQAATIVSARILGLGNEIGTIEVGKRADLFVTDGDPSIDIRALQKGAMVLKMVNTIRQVFSESL